MFVRPIQRPALCRAFGFTIVELIVIIALLGILSAVAISRFGDTQTYYDLQLKDQLISIARVAQQSALNRNDQDVRLRLSRPDDWLFEVQVDPDRDGSDWLVLKQQSVGNSNGYLNDANGTPISASHSATIEFDNLGNLANLNSGSKNLAFETSGHWVCITLAGYAYPALDKADCDDN